jgi:hypothetical protein
MRKRPIRGCARVEAVGRAKMLPVLQDSDFLASIIDSNNGNARDGMRRWVVKRGWGPSNGETRLDWKSRHHISDSARVRQGELI